MCASHNGSCIPVSLSAMPPSIVEEDQKTNYFFPLEQIPRLSCKDDLAEQLMSQEKPVILYDTNVCNSALRWTLPFLQQNLGNEKCSVFSSPSNVFKYFDQSKIDQYMPDFVPFTEKMELTIHEFIQMLMKWKPGGKRLYFQQLLSNAVGSTVVKDFTNFNWPWLNSQQNLYGWGPLTSNLLLIGMEGNLTPVHYDEQQNFFCQLIGYKRCILFHPKHYENLYPHPVFHPHDRQSQVDLDNPDFKKFPRLKKLKGFEAVLGPGDILYIPIYWWHHIQSLRTVRSASSRNGSSIETLQYNTSINFWYKGGSTDKIEYPLVPRQKLAMMRNIEKILLDALKDPKELGPFFRALVLGRYTTAPDGDGTDNT